MSHAAFSPDSTRVVTTSNGTVHIWEMPLDNGTLAEWSALEERGPYMLNNGVLAPQPPRVPSPAR